VKAVAFMPATKSRRQDINKKKKKKIMAGEEKKSRNQKIK